MESGVQLFRQQPNRENFEALLRDSENWNTLYYVFSHWTGVEAPRPLFDEICRMLRRSVSTQAEKRYREDMIEILYHCLLFAWKLSHPSVVAVTTSTAVEVVTTNYKQMLELLKLDTPMVVVKPFHEEINIHDKRIYYRSWSNAKLLSESEIQKLVYTDSENYVFTTEACFFGARRSIYWKPISLRSIMPPTS